MSTRGVPPRRFNDFVVGVAMAIEGDPASYEEAIRGSESDLWKAAMKEEYDSLTKNGTWTLVELPAGRKAIGSKWVYKKKEDSAGKVTKFKARLVAQGFSQQFGVDYDAVFAPVATQTTLRTLYIHQRGQIKGKVIKINHSLERAEDDPSQISASLLKVYNKKLELHYSEYAEAHREVIALTPSAKMEEQDEKMDEFDALHTETLERLERLMEHFAKPAPPAAVPSGNAQVIVQHHPLRAPIPSFDGRVENWPKFKAMFEDLVVNSGDSDAVKLHYLDKALVSDAAGLINAKMIQDNNFTEVWRQLKEQFENKRVIVDTYVDGLIQLKPMAKGNFKDLLELTKTCERHVAGLEYQGLAVDELSGVIITKLLTSRLDDHTLQLWERKQKHGELPNYKQTLEFLKGECQILERFQNSRHPVPAKEPQSKYSSSKPVNQKAHTVTSSNSENQCKVCGENHRHFECPIFTKMSISDRITKVKQLKICFNCLRPGHCAKDCSTKRYCSKCQKRHHTLLHEEFPTKAPETDTLPEKNSSNAAAEIGAVPQAGPSTSSSSSCSCNHSQTAKTVMLLTAVVNVESADGQLVPC